MRPISIQTQKILAFIPLVNFAGVFILVYQCCVLNARKKLLQKALLFLFPCLLLFGMLMALINHLLTDTVLYQVLSYLSYYLYPLIVFEAIIYAQIKIGKKDR